MCFFGANGAAIFRTLAAQRIAAPDCCTNHLFYWCLEKISGAVETPNRTEYFIVL